MSEETVVGCPWTVNPVQACTSLRLSNFTTAKLLSINATLFFTLLTAWMSHIHNFTFTLLGILLQWTPPPAPSNELTKLTSFLLAMLAQFMVRVINQLAEVIRLESRTILIFFRAFRSLLGGSYDFNCDLTWKNSQKLPCPLFRR